MTPGEAAGLLRRFNFGKAASEFMDEVSPGIVAAMRSAAPKGRAREGESHKTLEKSIFAIRHTTTTEGTLEVTSDVPQAKFVLYGTRPHQIVGRPLLAFNWNSGTSGWLAATGGENVNVVVRSVQHPGTKPNPFNAKAWEMVKGGVARIFRENVAAVFEEG
jgi:hypothetical protein